MSKYKKYYGYYYLPSEEQEIEQENSVEFEIKNEQENEVESKTAQNDKNFSRVVQTATNVVITATGSGQTANVTQVNGADANETSPVQVPVNVPISVPITNTDQEAEIED